MSLHPALGTLRERLRLLEERQRRCARTIPISEGVDEWLPQGGLPAGCIHEVKGASLASAVGFAAILAGRIAGAEGHIVYLAPERSLYPLGLLSYGMKLEQLLFVSARRRRDLEWAAMEAIRCPEVSVVMAALEGADLTTSRRLQLAAESSGATGFFLGQERTAPIAAPITRWRVAPQRGNPGQRFDEPMWKLDLLYCRGGRPGSWTIGWRKGRLSTGFDSTGFESPVVESRREALAG